MEDLGPVVDVLTSLIKLMVDDPNSLKVDVTEDGEFTRCVVYVSRTDAGKLIGKQGRTARSIRVILSTIGARLGHSIAFDIETHQP
jgi:predicted RNA-binding protein YlqC (UPF0109 family)